ncbi:hypothetical protein AB0K09_01285 [Streptomyces sp. NPDC049577]
MNRRPWSVSGHGSERVGETVTDDQGAFQAMRDPEGNEFCFVGA